MMEEMMEEEEAAGAAVMVEGMEEEVEMAEEEVMEAVVVDVVVDVEGKWIMSLALLLFLFGGWMECCVLILCAILYGHYFMLGESKSDLTADWNSRV